MKTFRKSTAVQSVLFDRSKWTISQARKWLTDHDYKIPKVDSTADYHRFRQAPPFQFKAGTFRTIAFGKKALGIKAVIAVPRNSSAKTAKNPSRRAAKTPYSRIPKILANLATALSVKMDNGRELKFPLQDRFALCTTKSGTEIWLLPRKGSKRVRAENERIESLYERFTDYESDPIAALVHLPNVRLKRFGKAVSITYRSNKYGKTDKDYIHSFNAYPTVSVDRPTKPRVIALRGGRIRVTAEGIKG